MDLRSFSPGAEVWDTTIDWSGQLQKQFCHVEQLFSLTGCFIFYWSLKSSKSDFLKSILRFVQKLWLAWKAKNSGAVKQNFLLPVQPFLCSWWENSIMWLCTVSLFVILIAQISL